MRYHLMPVRMAVVKKTRDDKYWWRCGEKGTLVHWEWKLVQLWKTVWRFLKKKKKNWTTIWSSNSTFGYVSRGNEITLEEILAPPCTIVLFIIAKIWNQLKCPSIGWVDKENVYVYTHTHTHTIHTHTMEYYSAKRKTKYLAICNNIGGLGLPWWLRR